MTPLKKYALAIIKHCQDTGCGKLRKLIGIRITEREKMGKEFQKKCIKLQKEVKKGPFSLIRKRVFAFVALHFVLFFYEQTL